MIAVGLALGGCPGDEPFPLTLGDCPDDSAVVWVDAEPIFAAHCTRCHSTGLGPSERNNAPEAVNFDNVDSARQNGFVTWSMISGDLMPPDRAGPLDDDALVIHEWLSCGGPE